MEWLVFTCGKCGVRYQYTNYKTGLFKTPEQLAAMARKDHVCRQCQHDDRLGPPANKSELDMGDNPGTLSAAMVAGTIAAMLSGERDPEKLLDAGERALRKKEDELAKDRESGGRNEP